MPYIDAAKSIGASDLRVILRHVLPNIMAVIIVISTLTIARVILIEASLSFLGFGVQPPDPTWGQMIGAQSTTYIQDAPWLGIAPGVAISLSVLAFNMMGDGLRDLLDPRLRGTR